MKTQSRPRPLKPPPAASSVPGASEILRCWEVDGALHSSIRPDLWEDPGAWGIVLADVAHHVARALHPDSEGEQAAVEKRILEIFEKEMSSPTEDSPGGFIE